MDFVKTNAEDLDEDLGDAGYNSAIQAFNNIQVFRFSKNIQKDGVMSRYRGNPIFPDGSVMSGQIRDGDVYVCAVVWGNGSYPNAHPLFKLDASVLLSLDEDIRRDVVNALFETNREYYEKQFREKIRDELFQTISEEVASRYEDQMNLKDAQIRDLEIRLDQSNRIIEDSKKIISTEDTIELTSEPVMQSVQQMQMPLQASVQNMQAPVPVNRLSHRPHSSAPGLPSVRLTDNPMQAHDGRRYHITRISSCRIRCPDFTNGKYFVHICPSGKFMVIRPHEYGDVSCVNCEMTIYMLDQIVKTWEPFEEYELPVAEYNARYDGVIVYLE